LHRTKFPNAIPVLLLLSDGEDGIQLWTSKTGRYNILISSYLNVPPSRRGKFADTMHIVSTYNMKSECQAEQTLFSEAFMAEMQLLYEGIELSVPGIDGHVRSHFIMGRNIRHLFDTMAWLKRMHGSGSGSKICSPCGKVGTYDVSTNSVIYVDNRIE
jgi:hypothetical protein